MSTLPLRTPTPLADWAERRRLARGGSVRRAPLLLTEQLARAIAQDAANDTMRKAGREKWSEADWHVAVDTFARLIPYLPDDVQLRLTGRVARA